MSCRQCEGIEKLFDESVAKDELEDYRANGPANETRLLLDALKSSPIKGLTLLDIGGGVGAIQHDLLRAGVSSAVNIDASQSYLEAAQQEAARLGYADQVTYLHGDFVDLAEDIAPADIVTLDRVICCYHDMPALVGASSARARRFYGLIFPRDSWLHRIGFKVENLFIRLQRNPMRVFTHRTDDVDAVVRGNGLKRRYYRKTLVWQVMVYERAD